MDNQEKPDILLILSQEHPELKEYFLQRRNIGLQTYGKRLNPFNGRDAYKDLFEELLDACAYAYQLYLENPNDTKYHVIYEAVTELTKLVLEKK
ncbi:hypothetical protein [Calothrix sp. NIES-2100]|uniref:hypothetical protein n=1 Tax=Calothrix sp. NIES-2100 TaxID=1954172 RepID=UPI0030D73C31